MRTTTIGERSEYHWCSVVFLFRQDVDVKGGEDGRQLGMEWHSDSFFGRQRWSTLDLQEISDDAYANDRRMHAHYLHALSFIQKLQQIADS